MERIRMDKDIHPLTNVRKNITAFIEEIKSSKRPIVITQHGKSSAVLMDVIEYEALVEKVELLSDIQMAENQLAQGEALSHNDAQKKVLSAISR